MATLAQGPRRQRLSPVDGHPPKRGRAEPAAPSDPPPLEPQEEPEERDEIEMPCTDDAHWDVFIADDDGDPLPEPGDFWIDDPNDMHADSSGMELL